MDKRKLVAYAQIVRNKKVFPMSENNKKEPPKQVYKVSDDLIAVIRELVQLSLLTGTNLVDHMRAVSVEIVEGHVVPTEEYVEQYNAYIEELEKQAEKLQAEMQSQEATDRN